MSDPSDFVPELHIIRRIQDSRGCLYDVCDCCGYRKHHFPGLDTRTVTETERDHRGSIKGGRTRRGLQS